jgi:hypothetical protein
MSRLTIMASPLKKVWHTDLASHPTTHAWVLNLYRAGERHPQLVDDYFPVAHAPWPELATDLARHREDERRHDRMYTAAIKRLGEPVVDMDGPDVFNVVIRECTPVAFRIEEGDGEDRVRSRLANFLAHAHFLEKRITRSVGYHAEACDRVGSPVASVVTAVLADEERHVRYTREAVTELVGRAEAARVLEVHAHAEARANLLFSAHQIRECLRRFKAEVPRLHRALYRLLELTMQEAAAHV